MNGLKLRCDLNSVRNKVRAVSSLPIAFAQTHSGSLVAVRFDLSIFLIGTKVPVVSSPRTVYDVHILTWVPLHKPRHPLVRYYTIAEPGLCTYGVRARPAPGSEEARLQHIQIPALGERKQCVRPHHRGRTMCQETGTFW